MSDNKRHAAGAFAVLIVAVCVLSVISASITDSAATFMGNLAAWQKEKTDTINAKTLQMQSRAIITSMRTNAILAVALPFFAVGAILAPVLYVAGHIRYFAAGGGKLEIQLKGKQEQQPALNPPNDAARPPYPPAQMRDTATGAIVSVARERESEGQTHER